MASSITEENITKLREAGYLAESIAHRLPAEGQITPTPKSRERVVFLPHFIRGLGFPLHPFVQGLMYYYGLDFHGLAPNFVLNILVFVAVCEAFLLIKSLRPVVEDLLCEAEDHERPTGGVRRCHGGQNAQCHMA